MVSHYGLFSSSKSTSTYREMPDATGGVAAFFTELVDAVRYGQSWSESMEKQAAAKRSLERGLHTLEEIQAQISKLFENKELDPGVAEPLAKVVGDFVSAAFQQSRGKIDEEYRKTIEELAAETDSFKLKSVKSLESFLATSPLPVLDEEIGLDLSGGSYLSNASYKCASQINYEFLLNTANSKLFKSDISASTALKGLRLPVRTGKAWLKKELVPDYEKLDNYTLASARASRNHLSAKLVNQATMVTVSLVFSRSNTDSFVTIEYADKAGKVDITGEPSLNRHLDLVSIKQMMERLLGAIMGLDREKLRLVKLECAGEDVLASLDCFGFMQHVVSIYTQSAETMQAVRRLDSRITTDRLRLLGVKGSVVSSALGFGAKAAKPIHTAP